MLALPKLPLKTRRIICKTVVAHYTKMAKFEIDNTVVITNRGIILTGLVLEGTIHIGDFMEFDFQNQLLKREISGIEGLTASAEKPNTGILIKCAYSYEINELKKWKPNKVIAYITRKYE